MNECGSGINFTFSRCSGPPICNGIMQQSGSQKASRGINYITAMSPHYAHAHDSHGGPTTRRRTFSFFSVRYRFECMCVCVVCTVSSVSDLRLERRMCTGRLLAVGGDGDGSTDEIKLERKLKAFGIFRSGARVFFCVIRRHCHTWDR